MFRTVDWVLGLTISCTSVGKTSDGYRIGLNAAEGERLGSILAAVEVQNVERDSGDTMGHRHCSAGTYFSFRPGTR